MSEPTGETNQFVVFSLGDVACGVPIDAVIEIMQVPEISGIIDARPAVPGMFDFRGHVVMVVDCRAALGFPATEPTVRSRVIVLSHQEQPLGLLVDAVTEVVSVDASKRQPADASLGISPLVTAVVHVDESLMLEIDWDRTLALALEGRVSPLPARRDAA